MFHQLILLLLVYTATLVLAGASKRLHIENLVVFGDSYSDNGPSLYCILIVQSLTTFQAPVYGC
jgi:phospholipase/lecithinase/hemolysin